MAERPLRFERRMSDAEALMWTIEKDPALRSSFLQLTLLDSRPDFARFRRRMERAVKVLPRLGQRVMPPPFRFAPPEWADDPSFELDFHVRRLAVPPPGTDRQLLDLAALVYEDAFDRARPLWQLTIVEGLQDDRAALLAKMHHTITDGVGGVRLSMQFLDLEPDAEDPGEVEAPARVPARGLYDVLSDAVGHNVRRQLGVIQRGAAGAAGLAMRPARLGRGLRDTADTAASLWRQLAVVQSSRSPLWTGRRSLSRRFETLTVNLDEVKAAAKGLGGTVNDLYVAALAGGAAAYHRERGVGIEELRMTMPVSIRDDNSAGGNAFSPARLVVPAGVEDPAARFAAVHERLNVAKRERALGLFGSLAGVMNSLPTSVLTRVARQQAETVDFAASNVRAADFDLYIAGARIEGNHPMGPTAGTAFNATVMSYKNRFDVGLNIDTAAIDDPELLRTCIEASFAELLKAGSA
ncbi:MAG: wax ester/triacylglycerol synthase family O-acyltransferase [Acidimicrobiia bacterium]|nr:wax ester/triacylglycerol synthase family O-acyltransferase [Acidimicrobiia bacterium]